MKIQLQHHGQKFDIFVIVLDDESRPAIDFLEQLKRDDFTSFKHLVRVYTTHAEIGPLIDPKKSRAIEGWDDLYEFKSPQGARLLYFYLRDRKTVITHGFKKGAPAKNEFNRACRIRDQYLREVDNG
jgi:hypothetical protein